MQGTVVLSKQLTAAYYGGHQDLRGIQQFPNSFDEVLIGTPSWWATHLSSWITMADTYSACE